MMLPSEKQKVPPKQHATCHGKVCLLDQFRLPLWCNVNSYDPKKNRSVVLLSSMHTMGEINATETAKPEI